MVTMMTMLTVWKTAIVHWVEPSLWDLTVVD
jgi:hypothetical protein